MQKKDTLIRAPSGTGTTSAASISILELMNPKNPKFQALFLTPTRELAINISSHIRGLGEFLDAKIVAVVRNDLEMANELKQGGQIAVGTPGRILDMIKRRALNAEDVKLLILDETDEILGRGFEDQIKEITKLVPEDVQIISLSSTVPPEILELFVHLRRTPEMIEIWRQEMTLDGIKQYYIAIDKEEWKFDTLIDLFNNIGNFLIEWVLMLKFHRDFTIYYFLQ